MSVELVSSSSPRSGSPVGPRVIRRIVIVIFIIGIGGMIAGSIADNNGVAITFGLITAAAALALVLVTQVSPPGSLAKPGAPVPTVIDEQMAADLETRIERLVADGADESEVRKLVGRAIELGRQQ
jgi:ABC-type Na+ efflux pump permease subunit